MEIESDFSALNGELLDYLDDDLTLDHPLIFKSPLLKSEIDYVNNIFNIKEAKLDKALEENDYLLFAMLHEKPWRPTVLFDFENDNKIDKKQLMEIASQIWIASENNRDYWGEWKSFFERNLGFNHFFMNSEDLEVYKKFNKEITLYHGGVSDQAISWTTNKRMAEWFAFRSGETSVKIFTKIIKKNRMFAYINQRNEEEVLVI